VRDDCIPYGDYVEQLTYLIFLKMDDENSLLGWELWIYDLRTNINFTLKTNPLSREDLDDFVKCYHPENRHERAETWTPEPPEGCWRVFPYEELAARDKLNLGIFWLRDESLEDSANLPDPDLLAAEIIEDLKSALEQFEGIALDLGEDESEL